MLNNKLLLAIGALIFFSILFCLPGSSIPKDDWLDRIWADKWVHIAIFTVLVFLWCRALEITLFRVLVIVVIIAMLYGFFVEIIQDRFIPNRSFDYGDLVADFIGSMAGVWLRKYIKKIDPCRNRGRNQN
jgi:amino acid permease